MSEGMTPLPMWPEPANPPVSGTGQTKIFSALPVQFDQQPPGFQAVNRRPAWASDPLHCPLPSISSSSLPSRISLEDEFQKSLILVATPAGFEPATLSLEG